MSIIFLAGASFTFWAVVTARSMPYANPPRTWVAYGANAGTGCAAGYWYVVSEPLNGIDFNVIVANP